MDDRDPSGADCCEEASASAVACGSLDASAGAEVGTRGVSAAGRRSGTRQAWAVGPVSGTQREPVVRWMPRTLRVPAAERMPRARQTAAGHVPEARRHREGHPAPPAGPVPRAGPVSEVARRGASRRGARPREGIPARSADEAVRSRRLPPPRMPTGPAVLGARRPWCPLRRLAVGVERAPAHRAQCGQATAPRSPRFALRSRLRLLARCEPPVPAAGRAAVGRPAGRSVHDVPRLEHLSVGLRTSWIGRCLLPPQTARFPVGFHDRDGRGTPVCPLRTNGFRCGREMGGTLTAASHQVRAPGSHHRNCGSSVPPSR